MSVDLKIGWVCVLLVAGGCGSAGNSDSNSARVSFVYESASGETEGALRSAIVTNTDLLPLTQLTDNYCYALHVYAMADMHRPNSQHTGGSCQEENAPKALGNFHGLYAAGAKAVLSIPVGEKRRFHLIGIPKNALKEDGSVIQECAGIVDMNFETRKISGVDVRQVKILHSPAAGVQAAPLVPGQDFRIFYQGLQDIQGGDNVVTLKPVLERSANIHGLDVPVLGRSYACAGPEQLPENFAELPFLEYQVSAHAPTGTPGVSGNPSKTSLRMLGTYHQPANAPSIEGYEMKRAVLTLLPVTSSPRVGCPISQVLEVEDEGGGELYSRSFHDKDTLGKPLLPNTEYELRVCLDYGLSSSNTFAFRTPGRSLKLQTPAACDVVDDQDILSDPTSVQDYSGEGLLTLCLSSGEIVSSTSLSLPTMLRTQLVGYVTDADLEATSSPQLYPFTFELDGQAAQAEILCNDGQLCGGLALFNLKFLRTGTLTAEANTVVVSSAADRQPLTLMERVNFHMDLSSVSHPLVSALKIEGRAKVPAARSLLVTSSFANEAAVQGVVVNSAQAVLDELQTFTMDTVALIDDAALTATLPSSIYSGSTAVRIHQGQVGRISNLVHRDTAQVPAQFDYAYGARTVHVGPGARLGRMEGFSSFLERGQGIYVQGELKSLASHGYISIQGSHSVGIKLLGTQALPARLGGLQRVAVNSYGTRSPNILIEQGRINLLHLVSLYSQGALSSNVIVMGKSSTVDQLRKSQLWMDSSTSSALLLDQNYGLAALARLKSLEGSRVRRCQSLLSPTWATAPNAASGPTELAVAGAMRGLRILYEWDEEVCGP